MAHAHVAKAPVAAPTRRLVSLDAFRGATIALMVLVNSAGAYSFPYAPLLHADWHGWAPTDVVFPSFVWIVGFSLMLSLVRRMDAGASRRELVPQILRRGAVLYALGLFLYGFPDFDVATWRILGVLQRIAICYVVASLIALYTGVRGQVMWTGGVLAAYTGLMMLAPVPGHGPGHLDVERNFAHYVDSIVLGSHNYSQTRTWDPEGIVSTLSAIATALLGVLAAHLFRSRQSFAERIVWMFVVGNLLLAGGLILDAWMPINKKLWTTSFVLFMAGLDFVLFAMFAWIIGGKGYKRAVRPLVILGMNAIVIYMVSELLEVVLHATHLRARIYEAVYAPLLSPANASLAWSLSYTALMLVIGWGMYRKGWFVRV